MDGVDAHVADHERAEIVLEYLDLRRGHSPDDGYGQGLPRRDAQRRLSEGCAGRLDDHRMIASRQVEVVGGLRERELPHGRQTVDLDVDRRRLRDAVNQADQGSLGCLGERGGHGDRRQPSQDEGDQQSECEQYTLPHECFSPLQPRCMGKPGSARHGRFPRQTARDRPSGPGCPDVLRTFLPLVQVADLILGERVDANAHRF